MTDSTRFSDAMALTDAGADGDVHAFTGVLNRHWTIGEKVHGGAMLALCANAARTALGANGVEPIAVSGSFLWAPDPGSLDVVCTVRKRGRRVSLVDVELKQGERTALRAAITLADPETQVAPRLSGKPGVHQMKPDPPPRRPDRAGSSDGRHRSPGPRVRHPAVVDHDAAEVRRWPSRHRVLGAAPRRGAGRAVRVVVR